MKSFRAWLTTIVMAGLIQHLPAQSADPSEMPDSLKEVRNEAYRQQLESFLQDSIINGYEERAALAWNRDYSGVDAFKRSVDSNRERWRDILNPPVLRKTGPLTKQPHSYLEDLGAEWIELPLGGLTAQGLLVFPKNADKDHKVPLVIVQHGIGSYPETTFSLNHQLYHEYGRELVKAGFAVLAPMNLRSMAFRNYIERLCRLIDTTLPGIELVRMQHLLDEVITDPRIDAQRIGIWGLSKRWHVHHVLDAFGASYQSWGGECLV